MKVVNLFVQPIQGVARGVKVSIGQWMSQLNLSIVLMDDFKVVLGMEILDQIKAFPLPLANTMCIMDGDTMCMVPTKRAARLETKALLAIQFN